MHKIKPSHTQFNKLLKISNIIIGNTNVKTIFEFGSRYGEDTSEFAKKYSQAKIFAFECNPNTLAVCREKLSKYKNVILTEKAVTEEDKIVPFYAIDKDKTKTSWFDGNQGASSLLIASGKYKVEEYVQKMCRVEGISLFTFMQKNNIPTIDLLWMDIQGAELMALKGLKEKISDVKIIHLEVEFLEVYQNQSLFEEVKIYLTNRNFSFVGFSNKGEYSADAIFVNNDLINKKNKIKIEAICNKKTFLFHLLTFIKELKRLYVLIIKKSRNQTKYIIKSFVKFILISVRYIRHFDKSFPIYFPKFTSREIFIWYLKILKPLFGLDVQFKKNIKSEIPIDVIIPTIDKDFTILKNVINSIKTQIRHPINNIFIISPYSPQIVEITNDLSCIFVNENSVLKNTTKESIVYNVEGLNRSGWLFQQLLKLSGDNISTQEHFLIIDSDTVLTKPVVFIHNDKVIFNHSEENHQPYYDVYKKIFGFSVKSSLSFVSHYMLFSKSYLREMKNLIEIRNKDDWENVILNNVDYLNVSGFSEYETYGNFMLKFHKNKMIEEYWFNKSTSKIPDLLPNYYKSFSLHSYNMD